MTYAVVSDVAVRLGRPISDPNEVAQVEAWLADVEASIAARFVRAGLDLAAQIALGDPSLATVVRIEAEAVVRRIQRPLPGRTSTTRSVDDGTVTDRWEAETTYDGWITPGEWGDLLPGVTSGAFSTRPGFEPDGVCWPESWA